MLIAGALKRTIADLCILLYNTSMLLYLQMFLGCVVVSLLITVTIMDYKTQTIPDVLNLALFLCGVSAACLAPEVSVSDRLIGSLSVSAPLFFLTMFLPGAFGGGDIKLMAAVGFLLGWESTIIAACIGIGIGGVYGTFLLISGKKSAKDRFAFGPALCAGIAVVLFAVPNGAL